MLRAEWSVAALMRKLLEVPTWEIPPESPDSMPVLSIWIWSS